MTNNTIVVVGTLDTRGDEVQYLKTEFEKNDYQALVIDVGVMGQPMCTADYAKEQIADSLANFDDEITPNAVETYVSRLRKKLKNTGLNIKTVRGLGYLMEKP